MVQLVSALPPSRPLSQDVVPGFTRASAPAVTDKPPVLPAWISDTFAAQHASNLLRRVGNTPVGTVVQRVIDDPFVFLSSVKIGGMSESVASANASLASRLAPNRLAGTMIGAAVGALSGMGQAMMTFPSTKTIIVGGVHGLVVGGIAGNVSVLENRNNRGIVLRAEDRLW